MIYDAFSVLGGADAADAVASFIQSDAIAATGVVVGLAKFNDDNDLHFDVPNAVMQIRAIEGVVGYQDPHVWTHAPHVCSSIASLLLNQSSILFSQSTFASIHVIVADGTPSSRVISQVIVAYTYGNMHAGCWLCRCRRC